MADKDIRILQPVGWTNAYTASGNNVGARLIIQNKDKGFDPVIRRQSAAPAVGDTEGTALPYGVQFDVPLNTVGCWILGRTGGTPGEMGIFVNVQAP